MKTQQEQQAKELIARIARQRALAQPIDHSRKIYRVPQDWEASVLKEEPGIFQAESIEQLKKAIPDPDVFTILVTREAAIGMDTLVRLIDGHSLRKTIFVE
jgi:hypothetical protein